ncbi:ceramide transfer protein isoform X1 [Chrysoperla carnea]|uniref:ceramide transfer protein isoform X1 n=1 Tax=Chrysoperla carnea TaxID=189513 RepID=UPI001D05EBCB|nr:ceramide transfer protein isoform X1 [Chrysoperla carnea]
MGDDHSLSDDSDSSETFAIPQLQGILSKWTNYIHGWQDRFIVLKDGTLSYYKSEEDSGFGCRGALSLYKATIKPHEFDDCRFDVSVNDCVWYLRATTPQDKQHWVDVLESFKKESGYGTGSENSLKRHGSAISLQSNSLSTTSSGGSRSLREKLAELETFKGILTRQINTLQQYFDACVENNIQPSPNLPPVDFKGEAITFEATTSGVLETLDHCLDLVIQREDVWRKKLEREIERRKRIEAVYKTIQSKFDHVRTSHPGPDLEEGPHSLLPEDEFYDAVESGLDKMDEERELRERLKSTSKTAAPTLQFDKEKNHQLWPEIERISQQQLHLARQDISEGNGNGWQLFAEDGDMRMYRREVETDGMVMDPLKACHIVSGVTGRELCHYFFRPEYRMDWETTLEQMQVLETISEDTLVFLQIHKRIWPASQRDALFWSHMRHVPNDQDPDGNDIWLVCNNSTEYYSDNTQSNSGKYVRIFLTVCLVCQTEITPPKDGATVSRDDIKCKITYCSVVNPGGWAPASVLRAVYKREYPRFLKRFTSYVINKCKDQPIMF